MSTRASGRPTCESRPPPVPGPRRCFACRRNPCRGALEPPVAALGRTRLAIAVDLPGYGMSSGPVPTAEQRAANSPPTVSAPQRDGSHLQTEWARWLAWWPEDTPLPDPSDLFADTLLGLGRAERSWMVEVTRTLLHEAWLPQLAQPVLVINPSGLMHEDAARVVPRTCGMAASSTPRPRCSR